jgi:hypothetical protein
LNLAGVYNNAPAKAGRGCEKTPRLGIAAALADNKGATLPNPRSLVHSLHPYWDIVESLVLLGRELPAFGPAPALADETAAIPPALRQALSDVMAEIRELGTRIANVENRPARCWKKPITLPALKAAGTIGTRCADSMKARRKPPTRPDIRLQPILKRSLCRCPPCR